MNGIALLLAASTFSVDTGWQTLQDGSLEYIIQLEPLVVDQIRRGEELAFQINAEVVNVRRFRVVVGERQLPRTGTAPRAGELPIITQDELKAPPGVQYGWRPIGQGDQLEYMVQLSGQRLLQLKERGEELVGVMDPQAKIVTQFRFLLGDGRQNPPRDGLLIDPTVNAAEVGATVQASHTNDPNQQNGPPVVNANGAAQISRGRNRWPASSPSPADNPYQINSPPNPSFTNLPNGLPNGPTAAGQTAGTQNQYGVGLQQNGAQQLPNQQIANQQISGQQNQVQPNNQYQGVTNDRTALKTQGNQYQAGSQYQGTQYTAGVGQNTGAGGGQYGGNAQTQYNTGAYGNNAQPTNAQIAGGQRQTQPGTQWVNQGGVANPNAVTPNPNLPQNYGQQQRAYPNGAPNPNIAPQNYAQQNPQYGQQTNMVAGQNGYGNQPGNYNQQFGPPQQQWQNQPQQNAPRVASNPNNYTTANGQNYNAAAIGNSVGNTPNGNLPQNGANTSQGNVRTNTADYKPGADGQNLNLANNGGGNTQGNDPRSQSRRDQETGTDGDSLGNLFFGLLLFISLGANFYMGWISTDIYRRYRELAADVTYRDRRETPRDGDNWSDRNRD